jgi:hypothetical protein
MESLKEGVKFVFNNKTILGALSLDMIAVLLWSCCCAIFAQDILKVGPQGWCFEPLRLLALFLMLSPLTFLLQKMLE